MSFSRAPFPFPPSPFPYFNRILPTVFVPSAAFTVT